MVYADDTTLSTTLEIILNRRKHESIDDKINKELININDWLKCNRLSLNISKCKYIIFHTPQTKINPLYLKINDNVIDRVKEFNFLGLTIDENLNWKSHINIISNKISKSMGVLNKLKYCLPINAKRLIYNSLILYHLNYCAVIWGYKCEQLTKLQKCIIRIIILGKYNSHTEPNLKLLELNDILKLQELKFYYKFENSKLPCYLSKLQFIRNTIIHGYDT